MDLLIMAWVFEPPRRSSPNWIGYQIVTRSEMGTTDLKRTQDGAASIV